MQSRAVFEAAAQAQLTAKSSTVGQLAVMLFIWFCSALMIGSIQSITQSQQTSNGLPHTAVLVVQFQVRICQSAAPVGSHILNLLSVS